MKYRILEIKQANGKSEFFPQYRYLWIFWLYYTSSLYVIKGKQSFDCFPDALWWIDIQIKNDRSPNVNPKSKSKPIKIIHNIKGPK